MAMKERMAGNRDFRASCIAFVAMFAMLITPLCGRLCASANGCGAGVPIAQSEGRSEECHHAAFSVPSESEVATLASAGSCNHQETLPAILSSNEKVLSPDEGRTAAWRSSAGQPTVAKWITKNGLGDGVHGLRWRDSSPPQATISVATTSVLRI